MFYRDSGEYLEGIFDSINPALDRDEPWRSRFPSRG